MARVRRDYAKGRLLGSSRKYRCAPVRPGGARTAAVVVEWRGIALTALFLFVATYGALFWAEQYVPSGLTSVIEASLPLITIALGVFVFRQQVRCCSRACR